MYFGFGRNDPSHPLWLPLPLAKSQLFTHDASLSARQRGKGKRPFARRRSLCSSSSTISSGCTEAGSSLQHVQHIVVPFAGRFNVSSAVPSAPRLEDSEVLAGFGCSLGTRADPPPPPLQHVSSIRWNVDQPTESDQLLAVVQWSGLRVDVRRRFRSIPLAEWTGEQVL